MSVDNQSGRDAISPGQAPAQRRPFDPVAIDLAFAALMAVHRFNDEADGINRRLDELDGYSGLAARVGQVPAVVEIAVRKLIDRVLGPEPNSDMGTYFALDCNMNEGQTGREGRVFLDDGRSFPIGSFDDLRAYLVAMEEDHRQSLAGSASVGGDHGAVAGRDEPIMAGGSFG